MSIEKSRPTYSLEEDGMEMDRNLPYAIVRATAIGGAIVCAAFTMASILEAKVHGVIGNGLSTFALVEYAKHSEAVLDWLDSKFGGNIEQPELRDGQTN